MPSFHKLWLLCALATAAVGQDRHDWKSVSLLHPGDRVRVSLKTGSVIGELQTWTPQGVTVGTVMERREDVLKVELYRHGESRAKHAAFGAMFGFAGGFAGGASVPTFFITRPQEGAIVGGAGAVIGTIIGVLLPTHSKEVIYSSGPRGSRTSNQTTGRNDGGSLAAHP